METKVTKNLEESTILLIGSGGMLGQDVLQVLRSAGCQVVAYTRAELDITDKRSVETLSDTDFDTVINCAAYTNVDAAEDDREACRLVNVQGVQNLVALCQRSGATFVHFSTDYVFDGTKTSYGESDAKNPINYYGSTKAEAEDLIEASLDAYYILRTSWLFGHGGKNFVETILRLTRERGVLSVVHDQQGSPTSTNDLSEKLLEILTMPYGIYHLTNSGVCTWYEYASEIVKQADIPANITPCTSLEYPQKAQRPKYSVLRNGKVSKMRSWQEALKAYLKTV
jgi:dTDP-4-dehydrorhamnose reductase